MNQTTKDLWLFDYNDGLVYEMFSQCEDAGQKIFRYLEGKYDFRGLTLLEIGAGSGKFTQFLAQSCKELYVIERCEPLILINKVKNDFGENIHFYQTDVKDFNIESVKFDVIFGGWSMTSMRDDFPNVFKSLIKVLKNDGKIILVENAGDDEFAKITGIEELSFEMREFYKKIGFREQAILNTVIDLKNAQVFYDAFPNLTDTELESLKIQHRVVILEADCQDLIKGGEYYEDC